MAGDQPTDKPQSQKGHAPPLSDNAMLDEIQKAQFEYFKTQQDPKTGLTHDRSSNPDLSSIAATGFGLTAYGVAADHGWVSRDQAADYTLKVLKTLSDAPQGENKSGEAGTHGFFYHFLNSHTATRTGDKDELSTIDTALLMAGVLYSKNYFKGNNPKEQQIRNLSEKLYDRVDWNWAMNSAGRMSMGWSPENGFIKTDWRAYNEAPIMLLMGMGSPRHPLPASAWSKYMSTGTVTENYGHKSLTFGPLFGHQYPQIWTDFRGIADDTNRKIGMNYFENSRQATLAQYEYAKANPMGWRGYGPQDWGLTACDGPADATKCVRGKQREFHTYAARGFPGALDDGTIAPTAAASSLPFAPDVVLPTLRHWMKDRPEIVGPLGFKDAYNPEFDTAKPSGWVDPDYLGIDQGPTLLMIENYRNGGVWKTMQNDEHMKEGLQKAGFKPDVSKKPGV